MKFNIIYLFLICFFCSCSDEVVKNISNYKETFGYVKGVTGNKYIYYKVGENFLKARFDRSYYGEIEEEKYMVKYDTLNNTNVEICYFSPVFLEFEKTGYCKGKVIKTFNYKWPFGKAYCVRYEYILGGVIFEREQEIPNNFEKYPKLEKEQIVPVEYWIDNPQRAILRYE